MRHTCIKDDGGTPNRRCEACEQEQQADKANGIGAVVMADRLRIWKSTPEFVANIGLRPPIGKIFVLKVIEVRDHPNLRLRRKK